MVPLYEVYQPAPESWFGSRAGGKLCALRCRRGGACHWFRGGAPDLDAQAAGWSARCRCVL
eukprot:11212472-Lingulodinium_polyedra.AAC.1